MPDEFELDAFISYSKRDQAIARDLAGRLIADSFRIFLDERSIAVGDSIPRLIEKALGQSRKMIFLMSKAAFESEWATSERMTILYSDPMNLRRRLILVLVDDCIIPPMLGQFKYVDWRDGSEKGYREIALSLRDESPSSSLSPGSYVRTVTLTQVERTLGRTTFHARAKLVGDLRSVSVSLFRRDWIAGEPMPRADGSWGPMATEVREFPLALQGNAAMGEFELESYGRTGKVFYFMQSRYVRPDGIVRYTQPGDLNVEFL